ncbi:MFS general substrate transporter [Russula decolorans]
MSSPSLAMTDSIYEEKGFERYAITLVPAPPRHDWGSKDLSEPEYPQPSRLYQCVLILAGFFATFQTIGLNQTYGIFQDFYTSTHSNIIDGPGRYAMASLIGTIGGGLTWSGSVFVGVLISKGCDMTLMCLTGSALMSLGFILASLATKLWHLFLTQALLVGIGSSMLYYPVISLTPVFFDRHRGFAMGIAMAGSGAGGLVFAPVTQSLLQQYGAPVTLRILGVWNFVICIAVSFVLRPHPAYKPIRPSLALAKRGAFIVQLLASFFQAAGNIIPLYYLTTYSTYVLGFSPTTASMLLAVNNGVNSVSRVAMGFIADYAGRQNTLVGCVVFSAISAITLWIHAARPRFLAFIILYGMASGGYSALLPTTIAEIYGKEHYSSANAAIYFVRGLGAVMGAPIAGALLGAHPGQGQLLEPPAQLMRSFDKVAGYDAALLMAAGVCVVFVRWFDARAKGKWKWIA